MDKNKSYNTDHGTAVVEEIDLEFIVNIEGKDHKWHQATITVHEIRELGKIPHDQHVVCEDEEGRERTLANHETVHIKHGHRHGRAPKYKRG